MTIGRQPLVLLVAQDGLTRRMSANCLETFGYEVLTARDSAGALALLQENPSISVLVTDVELGGTSDGLGLARAGLGLNPDLGVVYTARQPQAIPNGAKVKGAPILRNPYFSQQLVSLVGDVRHRQADPGLTPARAA